MRVVRSIKAHNFVILVFHPDSAHETAYLGFVSWLNVDNDASYLTEKFPPDKSKFVILALKILVDQHHLGKAERYKFHTEKLGQVGDERSASWVIFKRNVFSSV